MAKDAASPSRRGCSNTDPLLSVTIRGRNPPHAGSGPFFIAAERGARKGGAVLRKGRAVCLVGWGGIPKGRSAWWGGVVSRKGGLSGRMGRCRRKERAVPPAAGAMLLRVCRGAAKIAIIPINPCNSQKKSIFACRMVLTRAVGPCKASLFSPPLRMAGPCRTGCCGMGGRVRLRGGRNVPTAE